VHEVLKAEQGAGVAVIRILKTKPFFKAFFKLLTTAKSPLNISKVLLLSAVTCLSINVQAGTLPVDTVDVVFHQYDGGGMKINGPFVLVRKSIGTQFSLNGHYYVDSVSAASIDVLATASEYTEERTEYSAGVDFLHEKTIISAGFTNSEENDFVANSVFFSVSQDFFGDLSKINFGYGRGWDEVGKIESDFSEDVDRQIFKLGFSQVLTKNSLMGFDIETITDEGYLNNPYRQYRFIDAGLPDGYDYAFEVYPETRTSTAIALRALYYLPYRASLKGEYRFFTDSWGIKAHTYDLLYVHPLGAHWTLEGRYRYYSQTQADFYKDIFTHEGAEDHMARDKELSTFSDYTLGFGASYEFGQGVMPHVDRLKVSALFDYMKFEYDNFRDVSQSALTAGAEPLYEFDAWVTRFSVTLEY